MIPIRRVVHMVWMVATAMLACAPLACEDVDWDWEARWWREPTRQVRPERRSERPASSVPPRERPVEKAPSPEPTSEAPATPVARPSDESGVYQLYLVSEPAPMRAAEGVKRLRLQRVSARSASDVIQQLYLPIGVGGSDAQRFLLYGDREELEAASGLVAMVDVESSPAGVGTEAAFRQGIALMLDVARAGPAPARGLLERCRASLSQAAQGLDLDVSRRWMAAMLAGRMCSEQIYDYGAARSHFEQAASLGQPGSIERLAALWGRADSFELEGNHASARDVCAQIVKEFGGHRRAQAFLRAKSLAGAAPR